MEWGLENGAQNGIRTSSCRNDKKGNDEKRYELYDSNIEFRNTLRTGRSLWLPN
jgi:hypothetical protein